MPPTPDGEFLRDVVAGLSKTPKSLPCKYFYDEAGSRLFDRICRLAEYYPTRCESAILERHAGAIMDLVPPGGVLIEYGSGSSLKTRRLLDRGRVAAYVPVDISREHLESSARALGRDYPAVEVLPLVADFTRPLTLPRSRHDGAPRVVYFSGSTISNFAPPEAIQLMRRIAAVVGPGGGLIIAVDLKKDRAILEPAYDDALGVTAEFNLNLLRRINRELGGDFVPERFRHRAVWNERQGRIEMYLDSLAAQTARVAGRSFALAAGEAICTEHSYKFGVAEFAGLADEAGLSIERVWTDDAGLFSVQYARAR
jgi:dimethylhistidine N-methyltransferase